MARHQLCGHAGSFSVVEEVKQGSTVLLGFGQFIVDRAHLLEGNWLWQMNLSDVFVSIRQRRKYVTLRLIVGY